MDSSVGKEREEFFWWSIECQPCYLSYLCNYLNPLFGLDQQAYPLMVTAERNIPLRILETHGSVLLALTMTALGDTLQSVPNHSDRGASSHSKSFSSGSRWTIFRFLNFRALMATLCVKEQVYGTVTGMGLLPGVGRGQEKQNWYRFQDREI